MSWGGHLGGTREASGAPREASEAINKNVTWSNILCVFLCMQFLWVGAVDDLSTRQVFRYFKPPG